jgi:hypothetical protein
MPTPWLDSRPDSPEFDLGPLRNDVVEVSLLLPGWQFAALEKAARRKDQTAGETIRKLVRDFVLRDA